MADKMTRLGKNFDKELKEIIRARRQTVDADLPREISKERITDTIPKFPEWEGLKRKLKREPRKEQLFK